MSHALTAPAQGRETAHGWFRPRAPRPRATATGQWASPRCCASWECTWRTGGSIDLKTTRIWDLRVRPETEIGNPVWPERTYRVALWSSSRKLLVPGRRCVCRQGCVRLLGVVATVRIRISAGAERNTCACEQAGVVCGGSRSQKLT